MGGATGKPAALLRGSAPPPTCSRLGILPPGARAWSSRRVPALTFRRGVRRPGAPPERAGGAGPGLWALTTGGWGGGFPGVRPPPRRVSRPREACPQSRGSQIRGRVARNQVSQPRGRVSPLPGRWQGGSRGGPRPSDTSTIFPGLARQGFPVWQAPGRAGRRRVWSGARRELRAGTAAWDRAHRRRRAGTPPAGPGAPCPRPIAFLGPRRPRQLAAGWFATLPPRPPPPAAGAPASTSAPPRWAGGARAPGARPSVSGLEQRPRPRAALGAGGGSAGGRGAARGVGFHRLSPPRSDIRARPAPALIPSETDSARAGGTGCSCPLSPRATGLVAGVCFLGAPRSLAPPHPRVAELPVRPRPVRCNSCSVGVGGGGNLGMDGWILSPQQQKVDPFSSGA